MSSTPRARNQSQTRSTSFSGAEAPDVRPTVSTPSSHADVDVGLVVDQVRLDAERAGNVDEPVRVRRVARADHEQQLDLSEQVLHRPLPVGGRVADVLFLRRVDLRKAPAERRDDLACLVDRERRLRDVGDLRVGGQVESVRVGDRLDEDRRVRRLAGRAHDLLVPLVADQQNRVSVGGVAARLDMHLRHERARGVDRVQPARLGVAVHLGRDAVRREDDRLAFRHLALVLDEDRAAGLEVAHDVRVVDDLLAHVDGRPVQVEELVDRVDGPFDPGAIAARRCQEDPLNHGIHRSAGSLGALTQLRLERPNVPIERPVPTASSPMRSYRGSSRSWVSAL